MIAVPSLSFLILLISTIKKYNRTSKTDDDSKKIIYWEFPAMVISLYFAITGIYFEDFSNAVNKKFESIEKSVESGQPILIEANPSIYSINEFFENKIEEIRKHHIHVMFQRTLNLPEPLIGKEENQDHVIGKRFLGAAFSFEYYICYPSINSTQNDKDIDNRRHQMQDFLFEQLTQDIWKDFEGFQDRYKIHYIPSYKNYNSWSISTAHDYECGYITFIGNWVNKNIYPSKESLLILNNLDLKNILKEENNNFKVIAADYYKSQLELPVYKRDPCMIFYSGKTTPPSLRPISKDELIQRINNWLKVWEYESNKNKPKGLIELELIRNRLTK